jgi:hypothetical protein
MLLVSKYLFIVGEKGMNKKNITDRFREKCKKRNIQIIPLDDQITPYYLHKSHIRNMLEKCVDSICILIEDIVNDKIKYRPVIVTRNSDNVCHNNNQFYESSNTFTKRITNYAELMHIKIDEPDLDE